MNNKLIHDLVNENRINRAKSEVKRYTGNKVNQLNNSLVINSNTEPYRSADEYKHKERR